MSIPQEVLLTPEVAALLHRSPRTVHRLVRDGRLKAYRQMSGPNGAFLFDPAEVYRYVASISARTAA